MPNYRMREKLDEGEAIDLSSCERASDGSYIVPESVASISDIRDGGLDFCNKQTERWIWSIGRNNQTNQVLASEDTRFYQNGDYECLWLR